ncbi:hypothetical protein K431DRAFT_232058 [Polychaeton citri CBS 116435]|uniref:Nucleotidyltransferase n=1 Tax=Polychaeton citri CBS 116435 TaxID=1314669 RepID=A0A9P4Q4C3_9PEZI|nr:hypothetical protein K431DRAFT_232058 [Polychaeton citri CBS 116435]
MDVSFDELEQVAKEIIAILKNYPRIANEMIVIIGGLAVWKYDRNGRTTKDVDFLVTVPRAPKSVKEELLLIPNSPFKDYARVFMYNLKRGKEVQLDMLPGDQVIPLPPDSLKCISTLLADGLPYIGITDLVVSKFYSCGI